MKLHCATPEAWCLYAPLQYPPNKYIYCAEIYIYSDDLLICIHIHAYTKLNLGEYLFWLAVLAVTKIVKKKGNHS